MRLGTDPEVFLCDPAGKHISVIGKIGGNKWNPVQISGMKKGFTLQEDNVALEFGIPPAASAEEFVKSINAVLEQGRNKTGLMFSRLSCTVFPKDQMQHPDAFVFGCEPDFNAWTKEENSKPRPPHEFMRSAGGHIHVETSQDPIEVIQAMDLFLGVPSVIMDKDGGERRQLYGKAGAFRPKSYGVEYRTLSNFWVFDPNLIRWVWRATEKALSTKLKVSNLRVPIEEAINCGNVNVAKQLVKDFNLELA